MGLNGGKVRQCFLMMCEHQYKIEKCNNTVITASSVHSPQAYIVAYCAKMLGLKCIIGIGVTEPDKAIQNHLPIRLAHELGAEIVKLAGVGYNQVLYQRIAEFQKTTPCYSVSFGMQATAVMDCISDQVQNIPDDVKTIVVPCGSAITLAAVCEGVRRFKPNKKIIGIQIANIDRKPLVDSLTSQNYKMILDNTYPYSKRVPYTYNGLELDSIYESKAFLYMDRNLENLNNTKANLFEAEQKLPLDPSSTCFWVVGNFNQFRD